MKSRIRSQVVIATMTATSALFVRETIRDEVRKLLQKKYPDKYPDVNVECPPKWQDIWSEAEFPSEGTANIITGTDILGTVYWQTKFDVDSTDETHRFITAALDPADVEVRLAGLK